METEAVIIQEPVSTKTHVEEASVGVIHDQSSMEVHKVNLSTVLDDDITSQNKILAREADVVNGSGNKESEESELKKGEETKTISVIEEDQTEAKHSPKQEDKSLNSVNGTEDENNVTVSVEEISRNIANETVLKEEDKEVMKIDAESESLKENAEAVEAIKNSDNAEKISSEVTAEREKEEDITEKAEKMQGEETKSKASLELQEEVDQSSKDTEKHEHVLVSNIPKLETLEAETVDTSTLQETAILKSLETNINETKAVHSSTSGEEKDQETKDEAETSLDLKEDKERDETETVKTITLSDVHTEPCSSEIKDESHGRQESKDEDTEEKHDNLVDVPSTESEKYQNNQPETTLITNIETREKFEEIPSGLALKVDKEELKDEKIKVDQVDGTQTMEEQRGLDLNEPEAEQIDRNRTDETEESSVEHMQKQSLESTSEVSEEETSKTVDERIEEKSEEEIKLPQEGQVEGFYGLETKEEIFSVPTSSETEETSREERSLIDLTHLQEESCLPKEQEPKNQCYNKEVKSDEVTEVSSASHETVLEEEPMVQIKSEDKTTETAVVQADQTSEIVPVLTDKGSMVQTQPEEKVKEACFREDQEKEQVKEAYFMHVAEEETAMNNDSLHDVESTNRVLEEAKEEEEEEEEEMKTDTEHESAKTVVEDTEIVSNEETIAHESESLKGDNAESMQAIKDSKDVEQISSEVTGDKEKEEDITKKAEKMQESPRVTETPAIQGEEMESKASLALKEEVDQSSKDTEEHEHVLEKDITQCETLETVAVDTSTVQEAAILKSSESNTNETKAVHSATSGEEEEEGKETNNETSLDLKEETEIVKTDISSDEVRSSDVQTEVFGEQTETLISEIKDESQGREESVEVKSVQEESSEEKHDNLHNVPYGDAEKYQDNEPETSLASKTESQEDIPTDLVLKVDKVDGVQTMEEQRGLELNDPEAVQIDQSRTDETEESSVTKLVLVEDAGLDETTHNQTLVGSVEIMQKSSLESPLELSKETTKTIEEKIEEKPKEEVTLYQEGQEEGSNGLDTKEETVTVTKSSELGEKVEEEESELQKEQIEKHEPTKEEVSYDQQSLVEEKTDDVSSALPSRELEGETVVEAEKIEDIKANEEEQVSDKIKRGLESVEIAEPHISLTPSSEEQEHGTIAEVKKTEDEKETETEQTGDISMKGLEVAETTDLSLPSVEQKKEIKDLDEEIQIVALPLNEQEDEKLEESKEDKSQEVSQTTEATKSNDDQILPIETFQAEQTPSSDLVSELNDQIPREVVETHVEEETKEAHSSQVSADQILQVETSEADQDPSLVSGLDCHIPKNVEEIHEEETKEAHKLQEDEILPTEIVPKESLSEAPASMLASVEDEPKTLQEDKCAGEVKDTQEEWSVSAETKPKESEVKGTEKYIQESATNVTKVEDETNKEAPKLEESKEDKSQEITETAKAIESTSDQCLSVETSQADKTLSSDQTPTQMEQIQEEETMGEGKFEATGDQSLLVETSQAGQTLSLVSKLDDQISNQVEEIHEEIHESFSEAPVKMLASGEDEPVTLQERHVSAETEPEGERTEISDDQVETSTKLTKKTDIEVVELTNGQSISNGPENACLKQEELKETGTLQHSASTEDQGPTREEEHGDETLPVVEILKGLHTTMETERAINDSASLGENIIIEPTEKVQKTSDTEVESTEKDSASDIKEASQDVISREFEVSVKEKLQEEEESREIAEKQEAHNAQQDASLQEDMTEIHETVKEEDQTIDMKEFKKSEEVQEEKLEALSATRDIEESDFKKDQEHVTETQSMLRNAEEINEVFTSGKQITDPVVLIKKAELESTEEHVEPQAKSDDSKTDSDKDLPTEQAPKYQREEEVNADRSLTKEALDEQIQVTSFEVNKAQEDKNVETDDSLITNENMKVQDQLKDFEASVTDKETTEQEQKSNDLPNVQEDNGTNVKLEAHDDEIRSEEEKKKVEYVKTELEEAIKHGVSIEEKNIVSEKIDQEESKQTDTLTAVKEEIREEEELSERSKELPAEKKIEETMDLQKETSHECMKNTNEETDKTQTEIQEIQSLSSVNKTEDISKQEDGESEETKDMFTEVKESETTVKEHARKSLSDLIQKVPGTNKTEDDAPKAEEDDDGDEHKDDKTSPDSIVIVEAKDTVNIIKTQKKSQGILSGVGSKVKHSISKVKKVLTGKSSHTTKPSSPK